MIFAVRLGKCRWNPIFGKDLIAVKHSAYFLNAIDPVKRQLLWTLSIDLELGKVVMGSALCCVGG